MRPWALFLNTSRCSVVYVSPLLEELRRGRLGGAALYVLPQEPPPIAPPVAPNLIVTPHAAYYSEAAERRAVEAAVAAVRGVLGA
jgi:glycerate dehydrogenase